MNTGAIGVYLPNSPGPRETRDAQTARSDGGATPIKAGHDRTPGQTGKKGHAPPRRGGHTCQGQDGPARMREGATPFTTRAGPLTELGTPRPLYGGPRASLNHPVCQPLIMAAPGFALAASQALSAFPGVAAPGLS